MSNCFDELVICCPLILFCFCDVYISDGWLFFVLQTIVATLQRAGGGLGFSIAGGRGSTPYKANDEVKYDSYTMCLYMCVFLLFNMWFRIIWGWLYTWVGLWSISLFLFHHEVFLFTKVWRFQFLVSFRITILLPHHLMVFGLFGLFNINRLYHIEMYYDVIGTSCYSFTHF